MHHRALSASLLSWFRGTASSEGHASLDIEPQPLQSALCELAKQTDIQVLISSDNAQTGETLTPEAALQQLFYGGDIDRESADARVVFVHRYACDGSITEVVVTARRRVGQQLDAPARITLPDGSQVDLRSSRAVQLVTGSATFVQTFRLNTPYYSVYIRLHVYHPRSLTGKDNFSASPIRARSRRKRRAGYRASGSSTSIGFSRVQRLVV